MPPAHLTRAGTQLTATDDGHGILHERELARRGTRWGDTNGKEKKREEREKGRQTFVLLSFPALALSFSTNQLPWGCDVLA
jgi:hypothetical protein